MVQVGLLSKELGKDYDFLTDLRETWDYGGIAQVNPDSARLAVDKADSFITGVAEACPEIKELLEGN